MRKLHKVRKVRVRKDPDRKVHKGGHHIRHVSKIKHIKKIK